MPHDIDCNLVHQPTRSATSEGDRILMEVVSSRGHEAVMPAQANPLQFAHHHQGFGGISHLNNINEDDLWVVNMFHPVEAAGEPISKDIFD